VTPSPIALPIVGDLNAFYEAREGMLVTFVDPLTVSEYFELGRYGQIVLAQADVPSSSASTTLPALRASRRGRTASRAAR
jgi:predicted extracellular nuclease